MSNTFKTVVSHDDAHAQFRDYLAKAGFDLTRHEIKADGKWHNVPLVGQRDGKSGGYRLFLDERPYGQLKNHKTQERASWKPDGQRYHITAEDAARFQEQRNAAAQSREQVAASKAEKARLLWNRATEADPQHLYLVSKGVDPHGIRQIGDKLVVPLIDPKDGLIHNLQFISPQGDKRPLAGARKTGLSFVVGGHTRSGTIGVAEGFATAATLHQVLGIPVAMTIDSGNMVEAARALREANPDSRMNVYGDNDWKHPLRDPPLENVGREAAHEAAQAVGGTVSIPPAMEGISDWNDLAHQCGDRVVRLLLTPQREAAQEMSISR